jgi:hypothetical protein
MTVKRWLSARLHGFVILLSRVCVRVSRHAVEQVTWNDDGTMTLVIRGHVEPVRNGDFVVYVKT